MKDKIISSIMAGTFISLGALIYLVIPNAAVGSLFFAAGIFLVCNFHNMLFTRVCPLAAFNRQYGVLDMLLAWLGNGVGAVLVAAAVHFTRLEAKIMERLGEVVQPKLTDSPVSLFILAVICALFVGFAVLAGVKYKQGSFAQIFYVWLFITVFVFGGFEHIIADMFYIAAYAMAAPEMVQMADGCKVFLFVTLGNVSGGLFVGYVMRRQVTAYRDS